MKQRIRILTKDDVLKGILTLFLSSEGYDITTEVAVCPVIWDEQTTPLPSDRKHTAVICITNDKSRLSNKAAASCRHVLSRPIDLALLLSSVEETVDNAGKSVYSAPPVRRDAPLVLDTIRHSISCGGRTVELSPAEITVFSLLSQDRGRTVSYATIAEALGGQSCSNRVEVHVCGLRRKLAELSDRYRISNVRGQGYRMD